MANLFIGMGGSGLKTLVELRKKNRKDKNGKKIDHFLFIDTDAKDLNPFDNHEKIDLSTINVVSYLKQSSTSDPIRKEVDEWLDDYAKLSFINGPLQSGASANRPQGRLTVAKMGKEFEDKVKSAIDSTGALNSAGSGQKDPLHIYIVLSVAGGTGSSIFLDLVKIIYDTAFLLLNDDFFRPHVIFYLPDKFVSFQKEVDNQIKYRTNVFAFWKELDALLRDYFDSIKIDTLQNTTSSHSGANVANSEKNRPTRFQSLAIIKNQTAHDRYQFQLFNDAMLIDNRNINGRGIEMNELYKNVARFLEMTTGFYGDEIRSHLNNTMLYNAAISFTSNLPWIKQYWSAGYAEIKGGGEFFRKYVKANIKLEVYNAFYGQGVSKIDISSFVKPAIEKYVLSRIERSGIEGFDIVPFEKENSILNIYSSIASYWAIKFDSNFIKISKGIEDKNYDDVADRLKKLYENDFQNLSINLEAYLVDGDKENKLLPFRLNQVIDEIIDDTFKALCEVAYSKGLFSLQNALEYFDEKLDDYELEYEKKLKELPSQKSIVTIDDNVIINQNLAETIKTQYKKIKDGPGIWDKMTSKHSWYETELTILKNLIKSQFDFVSEELALKLKREICHKISYGETTEIPSLSNLKKLISDIKNRIDSKDGGVKYNAHNKIISEYNAISENQITFVIPDVTKFGQLDATGESTYNNPKINIFKSIFEEECGLAKKTNKISKEESSFIRERSENKDPDLKTMEDILIEVFNNDAKSLLPNLLKGSIESSKFCLEFDKLIEERLISNLDTILTSSNKNKKVYSYYANMNLEAWISRDPESFERLRAEFLNKSSVFALLQNNSQQKQLWISTDDLKTRIDMLLKPSLSLDDAKNNPENKTWAKTDEDAIILINHLDNLGFDNYKSFENYKTDYQESLGKNAKKHFPHIDVRFKNAMINNNNINDPINHKPILDQMKLIYESKTSTNILKNGIDTQIDNFLNHYFRAYFLLKFYEMLNINENDELYSQLVRYRNFNNSEAYANEKNAKISPFYQKENSMLFLKCNTKNNNKLLFDETTSFVMIDMLNKENLSDTIEDSELPTSWNDFLNDPSNQNTIDNTLKMLQISYSMLGTDHKLKLKQIIIDTKKLVDSDLRQYEPSNPLLSKKHFLEPLTGFTNVINELI